MERKFEDYEKMLQDVSDVRLDEEASLKKLKKQIDKRIAVIAVRTVAVLVLAVSVLFVTVDAGARNIYHTEVRLEKKESASGYTDGLTEYMRAYFGTFMPYAEVYQAGVRQKSPGSYQISMLALNRKEKVHIGGGLTEPDAFVTSNNGKYTVTWKESGFEWLMNRFGPDAMESGEEGLAALEKLPESVIICGSVKLRKPVPIWELAQREDPALLWAVVDQDVNQVQAGIPFHYSVYLEEQNSGSQAVKQDFLRQLELLLGEPVLVERLGIGLENGISYAREELQAVYDAVKEQDVLYTDRICIRGEKEKLIRFLREMDYEGIYVDDVRLSGWSD